MGVCGSSKNSNTTKANKDLNKNNPTNLNEAEQAKKKNEPVVVKGGNTNNVNNNNTDIHVVNKPNLEDEKLIEEAKKKIEIIRLVNLQFKYENKIIDEKPTALPETELFANSIYPALDKLPKGAEYSFKDVNFHDIDPTKTLKDIFLSKRTDNYDSKEIFTIYVVYNGLDIPLSYNEIVNQYSSKTNLIACPIPNSNPFEFRVFCSTDMSLTKTSLNIEDYPELNYFGDFSAYCNGNNYLYLSGGEETKDVADNTMENRYLNWISKINLVDGKLSKLDNFHEPRFWHSMIFIPNKYVFIVGGNKTKTVEVLNTETGEISLDSELNEYHSEPTLCLVNSNYLYCFLGFNYGTNDFSNTIERCNLRQSKRNWEIVVLSKGDENNRASLLSSRFFTISYFNEDNLLILGGDDVFSSLGSEVNQNNNEDVNLNNSGYPKSFIYNTKTDLVREYTFEESSFELFSKDIFSEKFFIPMSTNTVSGFNAEGLNHNNYYNSNGILSCLIPKQSTDKLKVYLINDGNKLEIKEFEDENMSIYDNVNTLH